jgi:predicted PurR-regulated permease PerM
MEEAPEPQRVLLHMPVDVRSASLFVIALVASVYALHWAQEFFVPLLMGGLLFYALAPLVDRLVRVGLPRVLAAGLVVGALMGGLVWSGYALADQANSLIESLPEAARKLRTTLHELAPRAGDNKIAQVQKAAAQLEQAAAESASASAKSAPGVAKVQIVKPAIDIQDYLFAGTMRAAQLAIVATVIFFITFFLLCAGDSFRRKLVRIAGPTFARRKITVQALDEIGAQIQRYLLVQVLTSAIVGLASGVAFAAVGLDNATAWGVLAGVLNLVPYIGGVVICGATALVALLQFGTLGTALAVGSISIGMHVLAGYMLTPWLTSRASRLNAVVVFVGVLAWGWLWGVWGLLLGTPILMAVKTVCDRVDGLRGIGELMGGEAGEV